jgi:hypothetical protein
MNPSKKNYALTLLVCLLAACGGTDPEVDAGNGADTGPSYPQGPYGIEVGDVVKDIALQGYPNINEDRFKRGWQSIALSDYYDPEGNKGRGEGGESFAYKTLFVDVSARWCGPCAEEAQVLHNQGICETCWPYGLVCYTAIFQNAENPPGPADQSDVDWWKGQNGVSHVIVADPSDDGGQYEWSEYNSGGIPFNMYIDLSTMKILKKQNGYLLSDIKENIRTYTGCPLP